MNSYGIDYQDILEDKILHAFLENFESLQSFYAHDPRDPDVWHQMVEAVQSRKHLPPREDLAPIIEEQNKRYGADSAVLSNVRSLAEEDTFVIATGQQTGLLTGPLYTIFKAITAVKLANSISEKIGIRTIPIFWMAADDHDFAEINSVNVCRTDGEPISFELKSDESNDRKSASNLKLGPGIGPLLEQFEKILPDTEYRQHTIDILNRICTSETSFPDAFAQLMTVLFQGQGLIIVDPTDPALKPHIRRVFEREICNPLASTQSVLRTSKNLRKAGFEPQVSRLPNAVNMFLYNSGQRNAMFYKDGYFTNRDASLSFSEQDLLRLLETAPERFTHNVITRPLVQDTLFPTLTYVGGPSEIAYYGQLGEVYNQFELPFPIIYPRASHTLVSGTTKRILDKHNLRLSHFSHGIDTVIDQSLRKQMPSEITSGLRAAQQNLETQYKNLKKHIIAIDPGLDRIVDSSERKATFALGNLEEKTLRALKKTDRVNQTQIKRVEYQVFPNKKLQERVVNIWQYIGQYGFGLMKTLFNSTDESDFRHRITPL